MSESTKTHTTNQATNSNSTKAQRSSFESPPFWAQSPRPSWPLSALWNRSHLTEQEKRLATMEKWYHHVTIQQNQQTIMYINNPANWHMEFLFVGIYWLEKILNLYLTKISCSSAWAVRVKEVKGFLDLLETGTTITWMMPHPCQIQELLYSIFFRMFSVRIGLKKKHYVRQVTCKIGV